MAATVVGGAEVAVGNQIDRLTSGEEQQGFEIVGVCTLERFDIAGSCVSSSVEAGASPCETCASEFQNEKIGGNPGVTAIAIRIAVNPHEPVVETESQLVG